MDTEMKRTLLATKEKEQYDEAAKQLLRHKSILAHILVRTVDEFKGLHWKEVEKLIEGEPLIGQVPIEHGMTNREYVDVNAKGEVIVGLNTEDIQINEGLTRFDSIFYVRMREGLSQFIVNIEAQKDEPKNYFMLNRAIFYGCRLISSQRERDFTSMNYNDIKKVYSIWICMNTAECTYNHIHLTNDNILGNYHWQGNIDLLNVVLIGVPNKVPQMKTKEYELHRLLTALFGIELTQNERIDIIRDEYDIPMETELGKEMENMCNLGEGVWEYAMTEGLQRGMQQGMQQGIQYKLYPIKWTRQEEGFPKNGHRNKG